MNTSIKVIYIAALSIGLLLGTMTIHLPEVSAGGSCSFWTWLTHNCAINPKGPCCKHHTTIQHKSAKKSSEGAAQLSVAGATSQPAKQARASKKMTESSCMHKNKASYKACKESGMKKSECVATYNEVKKLCKAM